jgi:hypothetical protein
MEDVLNEVASRESAELASPAAGMDADAADGSSLAVWYPVGIFLALLAAGSVLLFSFPGRWIG